MALRLLWGSCAAVLAPPWSDSAADSAAPASAAPAPLPAPVPVPVPDASWLSWSRWLNPATAPFIPVPLIAVDPDSGTTFGILPVRLQTDSYGDIRRIIAPDVLYNPYFGYGAHARVFDYPSEDEQWSVVTGANEHVERLIDGEYQSGRLREQRWSFIGSVIYQRDGTPRFFGIGNESPAIAETDYTNQQELLQAQIGRNLNPTWQLLYTGRVKVVDVLPGTLAGIASLQTHFGHILGEGTNYEQLNRLSIGYDTRDNLAIPRRGMEWVAYAGLASRQGILNESLYSEAGVDGRGFWPVEPQTILAAHVALRYLPTAHRLPFWALSSLGGDQSQIGGDQLLRGFGAGRFYDRDLFSSSFELRQQVLSVNALATHINVELAPFVDVGRVFAQASTWPLSQLHKVVGLGFRGIAPPYVVGNIDVGYGSEGVAVFTGINYPF